MAGRLGWQRVGIAAPRKNRRTRAAGIPKPICSTIDTLVQRLRTRLGRLRQCFESFPDRRPGQNATYSMADIAMAAFSAAFFLHKPIVSWRISANSKTVADDLTQLAQNRVPFREIAGVGTNQISSLAGGWS